MTESTERREPASPVSVVKQVLIQVVVQLLVLGTLYFIALLAHLML